MNIPPYFQKFAQDCQKILEDLKQQFFTIRASRVTSAILDRVRVSAYGSEVPLIQVASVSALDARTLEIRPWDPQVIGEIEKAIQKSDIGVTPSGDGVALRLAFPSLSEERRKEYARIARKYSEDSRVRIRNERRAAHENEVNKLFKDKKITEDEKSRRQREIDDLTAKFSAQVDVILAAKEKEILEV
ncbi:MAG: ribosome recycling factor [Elusimicrobiota bacterium]